MTRLTALNPNETTGRSQELFAAVDKKLGVVPNMMRTMGSSPAVLEAYLNLGDNLGKGSIDAKLGELIAITVAVANNCNYCLSAHTYIGEKMLRIDEAALEGARQAASNDPKTAAALEFAKAVTEQRGQVSDAAVVAIKDAGYTEGQIGEIIGLVALNTFTNYFNNVARTVIDFPEVAVPA